MGRKKPTQEEIKKGRMKSEYGLKYPAQHWLDFMGALQFEANPQMLHLFIEDCMELAEMALDQFEKIPHPEDRSKETVQKFLKKYEQTFNK